VKVTLIKPNIGRMEHSLYVDEGRMEPLALGVLAGMTPRGIDVQLFDDRCEDIDYDEPTDLVGITVETFTARRAYEIADEYRARGVRVVLGGYQPTLRPEEAMRHADAICIGDAEAAWPRILEDADRRELRPVYRGESGTPQLDTVPRRDIFTGKGYLPITLVQFTRGCPYRCHFCAISAVSGRTAVTRPVEHVVREVEGQHRKLIFFVDDNIVANRERAKELFRALIPLKIRWVSQASINMTHDRELMDLMAESGCLGNVIGFESIQPGSLMEMNKTPNLGSCEDQYESEIKVLKEYGLQTWAAFTLGHDHDTPESLEQLLDFAFRHRFCFGAFNILMPYPGTELYRKLADQRRLLFDGTWWRHSAYRFNHASFVPRNMTPDELTRICLDMRARWNSPVGMLRRFLDLRTNMRTLYRMRFFWSYGLLYRKETFKKQGLRLGRKADRSREKPDPVLPVGSTR
jgi:radical SAM superfamily enzyme YgiQ (UPF0313 family)